MAGVGGTGDGGRLALLRLRLRPRLRLRLRERDVRLRAFLDFLRRSAERLADRLRELPGESLSLSLSLPDDERRSLLRERERPRGGGERFWRAAAPAVLSWASWWVRADTESTSELDAAPSCCWWRGAFFSAFSSARCSLLHTSRSSAALLVQR